MSGDRFLPYGRQLLDQADIDAVVSVLRGDWLTTGPAVDAFEAALCEVSGASHAVAVNSGTAALHAMYAAFGVGPGTEIVTSPLTFAATGNAALMLGASVRFVDIEPDTGNIDPEAVAAAVGPKTRAVVAIDYAGQPADYDFLRAVADGKQSGVALLADAAHSLGATYHGRAVGTLADASSTSFHPVKPITTAEGGAVLTSDAMAATFMAEFRSHGITRDRDRMERDDGPWFYEMHELGYNYRLPDVLCALGTSQLAKLGAYVARRREIAAAYDEALADLPGLELPVVRDGVEPGWHLYVVRTPRADQRRPFFEALRRRGIGAQVHYVPVHLHPYYRKLGYEPGLCPRAEDFYARCVSLPIFPAMTDDDVAWSVEQVRGAFGEVTG